MPTRTPGTAALELLREGNARFVDGTLRRITNHDDALRRELSSGQSPVAVVLSCSDSRVAPSVVFDQRLGDLFTIRVAGNVTSDEVIGSIEYAVSQLGTRLVVVVGHTGCGAVTATLSEVEHPTPDLSPALRALTAWIRPAVERALGRIDRAEIDVAGTRERIIDDAMREHVTEAVARLATESELLARIARDDELLVVGARYSLETGVVDFDAAV